MSLCVEEKLLERFFIVGCQRSGTTLLRLILESHTEVFCYDETKAYATLQSGGPADIGMARLVGFKIPRWTEQLLEPYVFDEGQKETCANFYRGEKILFLIRDVRDNIASMLKLKFDSTPWCDIWIPRILLRKLTNSERFRTRYQRELEIVGKAENLLVASAALYWKYKTEPFFEYHAKGLPVLPVRYEHLVSEPRATLEQICHHLHLVWQDALLTHHQVEHTEILEGGVAIGNTDPRKAINPGSVSQWDRFLTTSDLATIEDITGELVNAWNRVDWSIP